LFGWVAVAATLFNWTTGWLILRDPYNHIFINIFTLDLWIRWICLKHVYILCLKISRYRYFAGVFSSLSSLSVQCLENLLRWLIWRNNQSSCIILIVKILAWLQHNHHGLISCLDRVNFLIILNLCNWKTLIALN